MFKLTEQNIVIVGSLNPAIIQPKWLAQIGAIPKGAQVEAKLHFGSGLSEFKLYEKNIRWSIDRSVFSVIPDPQDDVSVMTNFVGSIFKNLEHTPITAIGQNFEYDVTGEDTVMNFLNVPTWTIGEKNTTGSVLHIKHEIVFTRDDLSKITVFLTKNIEKIIAQVNYHYDVGSTERAIEKSKESANNKANSLEIIQEIFAK